MKTTYLEQVQRLSTISMQGVKLGLSNMQKLDSELGFASRHYPIIHVAGSNGKGSVSTKIAKALELSGKRVGLYTSPHIATFRERIRVNGVPISEEEVSFYLQEIFTLLDRTAICATFFEVTTLLSFLAFKHHLVDFAVLEVGLGGRFDATNIVTPCLSVITSISLEHTDLLGDSLEAIAREKSGIIKPGVPIVAGPRTPRDLIQTIALQQKSPYTYVTGNYTLYDDENRAIARQALEQFYLSSNVIEEGLEAIPPCRLEEILLGEQRVILDVGHNPDGLKRLFIALRYKYPSIAYRIVCGLSKSKDLVGCLSIVQQHAAFIHLTQAPGQRAASASHLEQLLLERGYFQVKSHTDIASCIHEALAQAKKEGQLLVICGTFFIMAPARSALGIQDACDPISIAEKI